MSRATELLAQATPLPWRRSGPGPQPDGDQVWLVGNGNQAQFIACTDASLSAMADFDLAAFVVNRLPDLEAAVDLLAEVLWRAEAAAKEGTDEFSWPFLDETRAVLARLRDKVPADV